jgi:hypothetical protein
VIVTRGSFRRYRGPSWWTAQLPWLEVVDCDDGVADFADEVVELELVLDDDVVELAFELELDEVFVAPEPVVADATEVVVPDCVVAAMAPVRASIPATLAAPTKRRDRRAGCGRRRLRPGRPARDRDCGGIWGWGWGCGLGSVIGNSWWVARRGGGLDGPDDRLEPSDEPWDALGGPADFAAAAAARRAPGREPSGREASGRQLVRS